jgi:hypothetical protein
VTGVQTCALPICNGSGGVGISKIRTDVSLQGEGNDAKLLGIQLSELAGNRLQVLDDGCYVGSDPLPYTPPAIVLSSNIAEGEYLKGESLDNMKLTVVVTVGSESIRDLRIYDGTKTLHVFKNLNAGSHNYTFNLPAGITGDTTFSATLNDGMDYHSNELQYKFLLPIYCGVYKSMTVPEADITAETPLKVSGSSFDNVYDSFKKQHVWMACPESRVIKSIADENGLAITTAFKKTAVALTLSNEQFNYSLYVFDTKTTGSDYKITFNF